MLLRRLAALVAVTSMLVAACGSTAASPLTDPKDILVKSIGALQGLKTAHMHVDLSGSIKADLTGAGTSAPIDLSGTTADLDVDLGAKSTHISATVPALLGVTADVIVIGSDTYTKVSLLGTKYKKTSTTALASLVPSGAGAIGSGSMTDPQQVLNDVKAALDKLTTPPVKGADEKCGDQDCYKVTLTISAADMSSAGNTLGTSVTGSGSVDVLVRKNDLVPSKAVVTINAGDQGTLNLTLTVSNVNGSVSIAAPPADQIDTSQ